MDNENIEVKSALQTIELLKRYKSAKTQDEKDDILKQMDVVDGLANRVLQKGRFAPDELITKITKAISLDQYRPKNMPITFFALDSDLDYVNGDFDTFDRELSQMDKNKENPDKIRAKFKAGTVNIYLLAKQFSADWIRRLNKHIDLVIDARSADDENMIDVYNKLFSALTKDFCQEHGCYIETKIITDWATADVKPNGEYDVTDGFHKYAYSLSFAPNISDVEKNKIKDEFVKDPKNHPNAYKSSQVRINITNVKKYHQDKDDFFYKMITVFAHEIHHALDYQKPRHGALGSQIQYIDKKTYVPFDMDAKAYGESATEISSYEIDHELFNQLKKSRF